MQTTQSLRRLAILLLVSVVLSACGSGPTLPAAGNAGQAPAAATSAPAAAATSAPAAAAEPTTAPAPEMPAATTAIAAAGTGSTKLQVTVWLSQQELDAMVKLADIYTKKHPDIQVEFINIID